MPDQLLPYLTASIKQLLDEVVGANHVTRSAHGSAGKQAGNVLLKIALRHESAGHNVLKIVDTVGDVVRALHDARVQGPMLRLLVLAKPLE